MNRNNMMRGRGRGRGGAPNSFASSHMRSLETEMEMLQRKRETLQYEQQRLANERVNMRKRPYESEQPSRSLPYYQTQSSVQNFAHLYDGGSECNFGGPQMKRRAPVNVWDDNRYNVNQSSVPQRQGSYVAPIPQPRPQPMPLMGVPPKPVGRRMLDVPPKRVRSKFYTGTQFNSNSAPVQMKNNTPPKNVQKVPVLRATEEPSKQLHGRLGLALGSIIKKMKEDFCTSEEATELFHSRHMQRYMRKTIRERLTSIMLNRPVGRPEKVVEAYREVYPLHTDKHILDNANVNADFDKFLKLNVTRIMTEKLDEIIDKMTQLCEGKDVEVRKVIKSLVGASDEDKTETNKDTKLSQEFFNSLTVALIEDNLPQVLPKYKHKIMKMLDLENEITTYLDKNMKGRRAPEKNQEKETNNESQGEDEDVSMVEIKNDENDIPVEINDDNQENNDKDVEEEETEDPNKTIEEPKSTEPAEKVETPQMTTPKQQQYFVKVLGQPSLPNRADAYKFFSSLNAVTIKKHKVIQNLLVVGFNNEQDYERAVAASDTVVGNCKLIIKTNDKQALSTTTTPCKEKTETEKSEPMLSPDLENQITDLLSTIKQEQTSAVENTEQSNPEPIEGTSNDAIVEDNTTTANDANGDNKVEDNRYSPTTEFDEKNLNTIQEVDETTETKTDVANIKNTTNKGTPMKKKQVVATPRTIRTRRSSKLEQQNN